MRQNACVSSLRVTAVVTFGLAFAAACSDEGGTGTTGAGAGDPDPQPKAALPCDVTPIIEAACLTCHGDPPSSSAPQALVTVEQWRAPSPTDPSKSNGQLSVERMLDAARPMPPAGLLDPGEAEVVAAWVDAGMPGGDCNATTVEDPLLNAAATCTSMDYWPEHADHAAGKTRAEMFPGMPCNDCHANPQTYGFFESAPAFDIGGTVFPSGHEPDLCAGVDGTSLTDVIVHIEDAAGKTWDLHPNAGGNFLIETGVTPPYSARVISAAGVRAMSYKPMNGDCNICHTQEGSNGGDPASAVAPGRIVVPSPQP